MSRTGIADRVNRRLVVEAIVALAIVGGLTLNLQMGGTSFNSRVWPLVLLALMAVVAAVLFLSGLLGGGRRSGEAVSGATDVERSWRRHGIIVAYTILVLTLPSAGFALTTLVFVPLAACVLGMPRRAKSFAIALALAIGIYLMFTVVFDVPLPHGVTGAVTHWFTGG